MGAGMSAEFVISAAQKKLEVFGRINRKDPLHPVPFSPALAYRDLMGTSLETTLVNAYPRTYQLLPAALWEELIVSFLRSYDKHSPYFWQMPKGLADFVQAQGWGQRAGISCLAELIHFEWLEIEVYMAPNGPLTSYSVHGDLIQDVPYVTPMHQLCTYTYPVFDPHFSSSSKPGEYAVFCFRHLKSRQVRVIPLPPFYARVMTRLLAGDATGGEAIAYAAAEFSVKVTDQKLEEGREFFQNLLSQEALLGFL